MAVRASAHLRCRLGQVLGDVAVLLGHVQHALPGAVGLLFEGMDRHRAQFAVEERVRVTVAGEVDRHLDRGSLLLPIELVIDPGGGLAPAGALELPRHDVEPLFAHGGEAGLAAKLVHDFLLDTVVADRTPWIARLPRRTAVAEKLAVDLVARLEAGHFGAAVLAGACSERHHARLPTRT